MLQACVCYLVFFLLFFKPLTLISYLDKPLQRDPNNPGVKLHGQRCLFAWPFAAIYCTLDILLDMLCE